MAGACWMTYWCLVSAGCRLAMLAGEYGGGLCGLRGQTPDPAVVGLGIWVPALWGHQSATLYCATLPYKSHGKSLEVDK
jgi:microcystin-dependent protein